MNILTPISKTEFENTITIKFKNINEGFNKYKNSVIEVNNVLLPIHEKEIIFKNFLTKVFELNNNICYIDFYIKDLNEEAISNLFNFLDHHNKIILQRIINEGPYETIYFKVTDLNVLSFINTLNCYELFFCTIYFKDLPATIWGNYNFKFPIFFDDTNTLEKYKALAYQSGLVLY